MTLEEIASLAGVSRATVSRVVNNSPRVTAETRERVLAIIRQTGYQPHVAAQALARRRTQTLAVVLPAAMSSYLSSPYYTLLLHGVAKACDEHDYHLMLLPVRVRSGEGFVHVRRGMVDGLVVATSLVGEEFLRWLQVEGYSFVLIGQSMSGLDINTVRSDYWQGGYLVGQHLAALGYRRVAAIKGPSNHFAAVGRHDGFVQALAEAGIVCPSEYIVEGTFDETAGYHGMQRLLSLSPRPEAVFCVNDMAAIGALRAAQELGIQVPHDIAVVGFDDLPVAAMVTPPLTTINQHIVQLGYTSASILARMLASGRVEQSSVEPQQVVLPTELVVRASCGYGLRRPLSARTATMGEMQ